MSVEMLSDRALKIRLLVMAVVPFLIILFFLARDVVEIRSERAELKNVEQLAHLIPALGRFVHEIQKERGISCGVTEKSETMFATLWDQRVQTDESYIKLLNTISFVDFSNTATALVQKIQLLENEFEGLEKTRFETDQGDSSCAQALAGFSEFTQEVFEVFHALQEAIHLGSITELTQQHEKLFHYKEQVGIQRGLINSIVADGVLDKKEYLLVIQAGAKQQYAKDGLISHFDHVRHDDFDPLLESEGFNKPEALIKALESLVADEPIPFNQQQWFQSMTERVDTLYRFEQHLFDEIIQKSRISVESMDRQIYFRFGMMVLLLSLSIWLVTRSLRGVQRAYLMLRKLFAENQQQSIALQKREKRFRDVSESVTDWIWEIDTEGRYTFSSDSITALLGYSPEETVNMSIYDLMTEQKAGYVKGLLAKSTHEESRTEIPPVISTMRHKSGKTVILECKGVPIRDRNGELVGYRGSARDITQEQQLAQAKDDFLAVMSHELRSPLSVIIGNSEILFRKTENERDLGLLHQVINAGKRQLALVDDILDVTNLETDKLVLDYAPFSLASLLHEVHAQFILQAREKRLELKIEQDDLPAYVVGDAKRIRQILNNLISNAVKFTGFGGITVVARYQKEVMEISVSDTGMGIDADKMAHLFERFHQLDSALSRQYGGAGLGLFMVKSLTEKMGGTISVDSKIGKGTTFTVRLKLAIAEDVGNESQLADQLLPNTKLSGQVLLVEDIPEQQVILRRLLEKMGLEVVVAGNGKVACDQVRAMPFDLIFMDMQMPVMDGIEATQAIRADGYQMPIIALTANVMQKNRDGLMDAGCNEYLQKPVRGTDVRNLLGRYLKVKTQIAQPEDHSELGDELVKLFNDSMGTYVERLQEAKANEDWEEVYRVAHAVKGSGAAFGYADLAKMAAEVCAAHGLNQLEEMAVQADLLLQKIKETV